MFYMRKDSKAGLIRTRHIQDPNLEKGHDEYMYRTLEVLVFPITFPSGLLRHKIHKLLDARTNSIP